MAVTMSGLRENTKNTKQSLFLRKFWHELYGVVWIELNNDWERTQKFQNAINLFGGALFTFVLGPIYLISRLCTVCFPLFLIAYLWIGYGVNIWNTEYIDVFQIVMITIYIALR